jgi:hypothetical protein
MIAGDSRFARRNFLVPVPQVASFTDLNARLLDRGCHRLGDRLRPSRPDLSRIHLPLGARRLRRPQPLGSIQDAVPRIRAGHFAVVD